MKLVAFSQDDVAGRNMAEILSSEFKLNQRIDVELVGFVPNFRTISSFDKFTPRVCIVASRHKAESGKPTLTCHATGNFGAAELGGEPKSLQSTNSLYLRKALLALYSVREKYSLDNFEVSLEVTHHGPTELTFPLLYMEVGSTEEQWKNPDACRAVAEAINYVVSEAPVDLPSAIGFGGPHYAPNFTEAVKDGSVAVGHMAPKYAVENLDEKILELMIAKTEPTPTLALIDWKGLKGDEKQKVTGLLEGAGLPWAKTKQFKAGKTK
ncbi:MAG: D-aminoacyl-tRNA deacylase [Candidatus Altiarchaeota archaeon]